MKGKPYHEKILMIIGLALDQDYITALEVSKLISCSKRNAARLLKKLYDMSHENKWLDVARWGEGYNNEPYHYKINISKNYRSNS